MTTGITAADQEIARKLRQRLEQGVKIEDFRVYGSRARGDATPDSDLDVYLVVTELTPALRRWVDEIAVAEANLFVHAIEELLRESGFGIAMPDPGWGPSPASTTSTRRTMDLG